jgi:hypothetical protein
MILAALAAASLIVPISIDPAIPAMLGPGTTMPPEVKEATIRPLESSATECIARVVSADPRFRVAKNGVEFNNLIVDSVPACVDALRAMIDTYDRMYGDGAGQTYFMGPYLDGLPDAVSKRIKGLR